MELDYKHSLSCIAGARSACIPFVFASVEHETVSRTLTVITPLGRYRFAPRIGQS